jgi:hypothetical protein
VAIRPTLCHHAHYSFGYAIFGSFEYRIITKAKTPDNRQVRSTLRLHRVHECWTGRHQGGNGWHGEGIFPTKVIIAWKRRLIVCNGWSVHVYDVAGRCRARPRIKGVEAVNAHSLHIKFSLLHRPLFIECEDLVQIM